MTGDGGNRDNRRWWALGGLTLAVLAVGLDVTVLSVALPTLAESFDASTSQLQWFVSGYTLVLAAAMLPAGLLGDRYGRRRLMMVSLVLFGGASAWCAYAGSALSFIFARMVLGLAGAAIIVMALSLLTVLFGEEERPRAVGVWAAANFLALPVGPILGGWLLTNYWWGWVFLLNLPVALIGFSATAILIPESRAELQPRYDIGGIVLSGSGLAALTYGLIEAGDGGWSAGATLAWLAGGVALLAAFGLWERRLGRVPDGAPLVDAALFRLRGFLWGVAIVALGTMAMVGILFTMPLYFQGVWGEDAMGSGLRLLPLIGGFVVGALPADRVALRIGPNVTVAIGLALLAAGMAAGSATDVGSGGGFVAAWMAVAGLGMGLGLSTAASAALSVLPARSAGIGSGVMQAFQKIGAPLGAAVLGSVLSSGYLSRLDLIGLPGEAAGTVREGLYGGIAVAAQIGSTDLLALVRAAFTHGMDLALVVSAGVAAVGMVLGLWLLPRRGMHGPSAGVETATRSGAIAP